MSAHRIELISIGDELMLGEIADTNSAYMASRLADLGLPVGRIVSVGDSRAEIASAFSEALSLAHAVIATGGLGPTEDDLSREGLADCLGVGIVRREEVEPELARRKGRELNVFDLRQATAPEGVELIPNPLGTAPGLRAERDGRLVFVLPGVPHEMRGMFEAAVLPALRERLRPSAIVRHLVTYGMREADIAAILRRFEESREGRQVRLGTRATDGVITIRLLIESATEAEANAAAGELEVMLGEAVAGRGDRTLGAIVVEEAAVRGATLAVAESCTGGLIASEIVASPGASAVLLEGLVTYSNRAKVERLGVNPEILRAHGAVSAETAAAMAEGARRTAGASAAVAVTGIAGPGGGTEAKPVGLVFISAASEAGVETIERRFPGGREHVRRRAAQAALWLLLRALRFA